MKKAFSFVESLDEKLIDFLGFPELKVFSDCVEVYFTTSKVIGYFDDLRLSEADAYRIFAEDNSICVVYIFLNNDDK